LKRRTDVDVKMVPDQGQKKGRTLRAQTSNEMVPAKEKKGRKMVEIKKKQAIQNVISPWLIFSLAS
jgi:hypothetical protein